MRAVSSACNSCMHNSRERSVNAYRLFMLLLESLTVWSAETGTATIICINVFVLHDTIKKHDIQYTIVEAIEERKKDCTIATMLMTQPLISSHCWSELCSIECRNALCRTGATTATSTNQCRAFHHNRELSETQKLQAPPTSP